MKLVIFGPPGSGKSTQAREIAKDLTLRHIVASDAIKKEIKNLTKIGRKMQGYIQKGDLVPEELIEPLIKKLIPKNNFILDGYPRRLGQARVLDKFNKPDFIIVLDVPFHVIKNRLLKRAKTEGRVDDTPETIKHRFKVYIEQTTPLLRYYKDRIILVEGDREADEIEKDIIKILKNASRSSKAKS